MQVPTDIAVPSDHPFPLLQTANIPSRTVLLDTEDMAVLTISNEGIICQCNQAASTLLKGIPSQVIWQNISTVLPQLKDVRLIINEAVNPHLRFLSRIGHHFDVVDLYGIRFTGKLYFNDIEELGCRCLRLIIRPLSQGILP